MSGHSKWAQIKHAKTATDKKKGLAFSKLVRQLVVAVKESGADPESNFKLRLVIEKAKSAEMPKDNIERAIQKAAGGGDGTAIEQVVYEGFGPHGTAFLIEAATDNKNRTTSNIRHTLEKYGGALGQPGTVAWNFETRGQILLTADDKEKEELELRAIDVGAEDVKISPEGLEIYTAPLDLKAVKLALKDKERQIISAEVIKEAKNKVTLTENEKEQVHKLLDILNEDEDVIAVYTSAQF